MVVLIINELKNTIFLATLRQRTWVERVQLLLIFIHQIAQWFPTMKLPPGGYITTALGLARTTPPVAEKETQVYTPWSSSV